jgi:hypothetical protein
MILGNNTTGNANGALQGNTFIASPIVVPSTCQLKSISLNVTAARGFLRMALYDDTGPSSGPGALIAEMDGGAIQSVLGWNTRSLATPVAVNPGNYFLVLFTDATSLDITFNNPNPSGGLAYFGTSGAIPFAPAPNPFPAVSISHWNASWSFYGTFEAQVTVPDLVGDNLVDTFTALAGTGLVPGVITGLNSDTVAVGKVISQSPVSGQMAAPESAVDLVISLGPVIVPTPPTPPTGGALSKLQFAVVQRLEADPYWWFEGPDGPAQIPIITEKKGDLIAEINTTIGQLGVCLVVVTPTFRFFDPDSLNGEGYAEVNVLFYENVLLNNTGVHACDGCEHAVTQLHGWPHGVPACAGAVPVLISLPEGIKFSKVGPPLLYTASFKAHVSLQT